LSTELTLPRGTLTAEHYEDAVAQDPRIDELRVGLALGNSRTVSDWSIAP